MEWRSVAALAIVVGFFAALLVAGFLGLAGGGARSCRPPLVAGHGLNATVTRVSMEGSVCHARVAADRRIGRFAVKGGYAGAGPGGLEVYYRPGSTVRVELWPAVWRVVVEANASGVDALVNGSRRSLPATVEAADSSTLTVEPLPSRAYVPLNSTVELRVTGNMTVRLLYARRLLSVRLAGNLEGVSVLVNGSPVTLPATVEAPYGSLLRVEPLPAGRGRVKLLPLNSTVELRVTGNMTVRLYWRRLLDWRYTGPLPSCSGVLVYSDAANTTVVANWRNVSLPACLQPPVHIQPPVELPLNETHSLWLAWATIESAGSRAWWNPLVNGTLGAYKPRDWPQYYARRTWLHIHGPARVRLHYLPGLKNLPYVQRVVKVPFKDWYEVAPWNVTIEKYMVFMRGVKKDKWGLYDAFVILVFPKDVGQVWLLLDQQPPEPSTSYYIAPTPLKGQELYSPGFWVDAPAVSKLVWINLTRFMLYWKGRLEHVNTSEYLLVKMYSKGEIDTLDFNRGWGNIRLDLTLEVATIDAKHTEKLPNTGEHAIVVWFRHYGRAPSTMRVVVMGVGP